MNKEVPFISNTEDDLHCLQAAYMMIAQYFDPAFSIDMDEWSKLTGYEEDKGTWTSAGLLWFKDHGYEVKHVSGFDYQAFAGDPEQYLIELTGPEVGAWQIAHSNLPLEVERANKLLVSGIAENRIPTIEDIKQYLDDGYLVRVLVNMSALNGKDGYVGHALTVFDYDDTHITFHDPGLPPVPNRKVTFEEFEKAWANPNPESKELDAIRKL